MTQPLLGACIVVTRPQDQAGQLNAWLAEQGARVLAFPVTQITAVADTSSLQALQARLEEFSLAFFVSANAVEQFFAVVDRARWPDTLAVATVGPATARALRAKGFAQVIVPKHRFDSEGVLDLPEFQPRAVAGRKVLILRGDGGRELLGETLIERGATVEQVQCYQRHCAHLDASALTQHSEALSAIVFSNSEAIRHFTQILGAHAAGLLERLPVFVPHPRIQAQAKASGARRTVLTEAGDEGILAGILEHLGTS